VAKVVDGISLRIWHAVHCLKHNSAGAKADTYQARDDRSCSNGSGGLIAPAECAMHLVDFLLDEDFGREPVVDLRDLGR